MLNKQSGAILVTTLIILFALTFFVLSGSQSVVMQEKMTAAVRDIHVSLEIAESGLKDGEVVVAGLTDLSQFNDSGSNGFYSEGFGPSDLFTESTWETDITHTAATAVSGQQARYFIEYMGVMPLTGNYDTVTIHGYGETAVENNAHLFKVVSRALGGSGNSERILVSYYSKNL